MTCQDDRFARSAFTLHHRIEALMAHTKRYAFRGASRLAYDAKVSKSGLSRVLNGHSSPSLVLAIEVTRALEKELGRPLEISDAFTLSGQFRRTACEAAGCDGCLPDSAYDGEGNLKPQWEGVQPGTWETMPDARFDCE